MSRLGMFILACALGALALVPPATGLASDDGALAGDLVRQGESFFKTYHYREALAAYEKAGSLDPGDVGILKLVAGCQAALCPPSSKDPSRVPCLAKVIAAYEEYLSKVPDDQAATKSLLIGFMNAEKYDDAIAYFKDRRPKDSRTIETIAMLYSKKGDYDNSIDWQKKRADLEPNNAEVHYSMGVAAWDASYNASSQGVSAERGLRPEKRKKILDFGIASLDRAISLNPNYFEAMLYKAMIYREYIKLEPDAARQAQLKANAEEWQKKALEARKRQSP